VAERYGADYVVVRTGSPAVDGLGTPVYRAAEILIFEIAP